MAANWIYNRTPHSAIGYVTPYERRNQKQPDLENFRIWGSIVYLLDPAPKKLGPRGNERILIGYKSGQYKLFDPETRNTTWTRDAMIMEGQYMELENDDATELAYPESEYQPDPTDPLGDINKPLGSAINTSESVNSDLDSGPNAPEAERHINVIDQLAGYDPPEPSEQRGSSEQYGDLSEQHGSSEWRQQLKTAAHKAPQHSIPDHMETSDDEDVEIILTANEIRNSRDSFTYKEAMAAPDAAEWHKACQAEMNNHVAAGTWRLVPRSAVTGRKILRGKWVFKTKLNSNNRPIKRKAR